MFAYCNNSPVIYKDNGGTSAIVVLAATAGLASLLFELCISVIVIRLVYEVVSNVVSMVVEAVSDASITSDSISSNIDWDGGDKNHILKGTKNKHVSGWERFGINPNNNNDWNKLLPILKDVVDNADDYWEEITKAGERLLYYSKTYIEEGVNVIVKIWTSADGLTQKLSDAIPYIIK